MLSEKISSKGLDIFIETLEYIYDQEEHFEPHRLEEVQEEMLLASSQGQDT
jgi:hypothetical protein